MAQVIKFPQSPKSGIITEEQVNQAVKNAKMTMFVDLIREVIKEDAEKPAVIAPDYSIAYGEKYEAGLDVAEIAKRIRADIKADIKAGILPKGKYSVTIQRYSGGQSINVSITPESNKLMFNAENVIWQHENPHQWSGGLGYGHPASEIYTTEGKRVLDRVGALVNAYNFDGSDSSYDYYNVNFYGKVSFSSDFERTQKEQIKEWY